MPVYINRKISTKTSTEATTKKIYLLPFFLFQLLFLTKTFARAYHLKSFSFKPN